MKLFIKTLLVVFLLIAAGLLAWPVMSERFIDKPLLSAKIQSDKDLRAAGDMLPQAESPDVTDSEPGLPGNDHPRIYRWVDENGRTVYSDQPNHADAQAYTPKELAQLKVSGVPQPVRPVESVTKTAPAVVERPVQVREVPPEFEFSMTSAGWEREYVVLSGRISGGYACKQLEVWASAKSDAGGRVWGIDVVSYNGFGSTLYEIRRKSRTKINGRRPWWEPQSVSARCMD